MNFVIPMAGKGSRFIKEGYTLPKYLIQVNNKKLLEYSLESLPLQLASKIVFIALREHQEKYDIISEIHKLVEDKSIVEFVFLDDVTRGQAETVLMAKESIDFSKDLIIFNIDTHFTSKSIEKTLSNPKKKKDGVLGAFKDNGTHWSFAKLNDKNIVEKTTEKDPISNNALTGFYHFTNANDFFKVAEFCVSNGITNKNEFYIAPMYNLLIEENREFILDFVDEFTPLGTPEEVRNYEKKL